MFNIIKKIWASPVTFVGLAAGCYYLIYCIIHNNRYKIAFENNALTFTMETGARDSSITCGNVILHISKNIDKWNSRTIITSYCGKFMTNLGKHEEMHTYQTEKWGIIFGIEWIIDELRQKTETERWYEKEADEYARVDY